MTERQVGPAHDPADTDMADLAATDLAATGDAVTDYAVSGDLHLTPTGSLDGWVWSRDRPDQALIAEILVDEARIGAIVAARPQRDLALRGIGDGKHGFSFRPTAGAIPDTGPVVITARERQSGQIFARIVRDGPAVAPQHQVALDAAQAQIATLWAGLEAVRPRASDPGRRGRMQAAFKDLSALLAVRARGGGEGAATEIAVAHERLRRQCGTVRLPLLAAPALSLVLPVGADAALILGHLRAIMPALTDIGVEVILVDSGLDPRGALIPALAANVVYLRAPAPPAGLRATADALLAARGRTVALLEPGPAPPSRAALIALAARAAAAPRTVLLGAHALAAAARVGWLDDVTEAQRAPGRLGLVLALDRDLLRAAGGLDPAMREAAGRDGAGLDGADLWLRCRMLGARALAWTEPPGAPAAPDRDAIPIHAIPPHAAPHPLAGVRDRQSPPPTDAAHA